MIESLTPVQRFEDGLRQGGYRLDFSAPSCRKLVGAGTRAGCSSAFYIVPIEGHGQSATYLFQEGPNGTFDLWELEETPFSVDEAIDSVARRLPQRVSVHAYLTQKAEAMG